MRSSLARSIAVAVACAAGLSASLTVTPAVASAPAASEKGAVTRFGYKASVYGTKLLVNNVEVRTLRDADLQLPCTRIAGVRKAQPSLATLPIENDLIKVAATSSESKTYRDAAKGINGVRAISTVADIELGGEVAGVATPVLTIEGLRSVADSFYDAQANNGAGAFRETHSFGFQGMKLTMPENSPVPAEVQQLLDILSQVTAPVTQIVNQVVQLLTELAAPLEIPGLGSISLGTSSGKTGPNFAAAEAYALRILVDATGEDTVLQLGRASSRISRPVPAGVFRSTMSALELTALNDIVSLGGIAQRSIPCEGTFGKVRTISTPTASLVHEQLGVSLKGMKYTYQGLQKGAVGRGFSSAQVDEVRVAVPNSLDILIKGLSSRVDVYAPGKGQEVRKKVSTTFAQILVNGVDITDSLRPGPGYTFDNGVVQMLVQQDRNYYGTKVSGLVIQLTALDTAINLGQVSARFLTK
ncbi:hypothetical protein NSZ01_22860 [Nocardioides szechwanensis]|uniref:Uncharacterized protein n=1 Tax=Nocardioides szechwanensis TaxID=1005944 RepID=A0A1H0II96_9ACTN|nr:hypothetical protein [Nocardioides szechwanensis]GEP34518.1 hypothetical protein NSZ01_22860 [Nocardioides szechwanensis]SDO31113.1 hypothetical protein SAMN05192576_3809 [Nocardioides szechwanensis]